MGSAFDNAAVIQYHNGVGILDGGEAVGDDKHGASGHQCVHTPLHNGLGARVNRAGRLIQDHDRRVGDRRARDSQQLALALA